MSQPVPRIPPDDDKPLWLSRWPFREPAWRGPLPPPADDED